MEITFKKEGLLKGDKKQVKVSFTKNHLRVEAKTAPRRSIKPKCCFIYSFMRAI